MKGQGIVHFFAEAENKTKQLKKWFGKEFVQTISITKSNLHNSNLEKLVKYIDSIKKSNNEEEPNRA
ncbi:28324_t:CDS:2 [Dentiscutata erythropus]|uniref:28324_t:CDS:1 n=1 Tax=Dentiscutata erythropus TaxID=1348616 RepID=A0A9N9FLK1_9GLOM|nr:28324_t:CDS:2 [Dentiscutata erythropus]